MDLKLIFSRLKIEKIAEFLSQTRVSFFVLMLVFIFGGLNEKCLAKGNVSTTTINSPEECIQRFIREANPGLGDGASVYSDMILESCQDAIKDSPLQMKCIQLLNEAQKIFIYQVGRRREYCPKFKGFYERLNQNCKTAYECYGDDQSLKKISLDYIADEIANLKRISTNLKLASKTMVGLSKRNWPNYEMLLKKDDVNRCFMSGSGTIEECKSRFLGSADKQVRKIGGDAPLGNNKLNSNVTGAPSGDSLAQKDEQERNKIIKDALGFPSAFLPAHQTAAAMMNLNNAQRIDRLIEDQKAKRESLEQQANTDALNQERIGKLTGSTGVKSANAAVPRSVLAEQPPNPISSKVEAILQARMNPRFSKTESAFVPEKKLNRSSGSGLSGFGKKGSALQGSISTNQERSDVPKAMQADPNSDQKNSTHSSSKDFSLKNRLIAHLIQERDEIDGKPNEVAHAIPNSASFSKEESNNFGAANDVGGESALNSNPSNAISLFERVFEKYQVIQKKRL